MSDLVYDTASRWVPVLVSTALGCAGTYFVTRMEYRRELIYNMYTNVFLPLYSLFRRYIENNVTSLEEDELATLKERALQTLKQDRTVYPIALLKHTSDLSMETFKDYCEYIDNNNKRCVSRLNLYSPYVFFGEDIGRAKIIFFISLSCAILSFVATFVFASILAVKSTLISLVVCGISTIFAVVAYDVFK